MKKLLTLLLALALLAAGHALAEEADEARRAVLDAMEVYSWFVMTPLDMDVDAPAQDGFYPVLDEVLGSAGGMQARLDEYFAPEIQQALWAWDSYREIDGRLYGCAPGHNPLERPADPDIADVTIELTGESEGRREYTARVVCLSLDEALAYTFVSELQDGRWVFTQFPFFW